MSVRASDQRRRQLASIHIRKKDLRMDDDTYRQMLWTVARVQSAKDLDHAGRARVLDHMKSLGVSPAGQRLHNADGRDRGPLLKKITALLAERKRPTSYADGMARKMFATERVEWCTPDQLRRIVAALVYDQRRHDERQKQHA